MKLQIVTTYMTVKGTQHTNDMQTTWWMVNMGVCGCERGKARWLLYIAIIMDEQGAGLSAHSHHTPTQ